MYSSSDSILLILALYKSFYLLTYLLIYQQPVNDVCQLKQRLIEFWSGLQQTIVDEAIDEW